MKGKFGMNRKGVSFMLLLVLTGVVSIRPAGSISQDDAEKTELILSKLGSENWVDRRNGLLLITAHELEDQSIRDFLVSLLREEIQFRKENHDRKDFPWEGWGESYWFDLIDLVASLKEERVVPLIVETTEWTYSRKVEEHLAELGEPAVRPLLEAKGDREKRHGALSYLEAIVRRDNLFPETISDSTEKIIKDNMMDLLESEEPSLRRDAVDVLGEFQDPDVINILREISMNDPHCYIKKKVEAERIIYPIRQLAKEKLEAIEKTRRKP